MNLQSLARVLPVAAIVLALSASGQDERSSEALRLAAGKAASSLVAAQPTGGKTIALLPLGGDTTGVLAGALKSAITAKGLACVEAKDDPFFDEIMKQVEWDERKEDMLDAGTVSRFGKLQAGQLLLYGWVRQCDVSPRRAYAEIELHLSSVETKRHLWGGTFVSREYTGEGVRGMVDLDEPMRGVLKRAFADAAKSLGGSTKLGSAKTVAIVPLAGDLDRYATGLAEGMFSSLSAISPRDLGAKTLAEGLAEVRGGSSKADAVLYGAVRDLSVALVQEDVIKGNTYRYHAEVQLRIQAGSGDILWSDTIAVGEDVFVPRDAVADAVNAAAKNPKTVMLVIGGILALLVLLVVIRMFFGAVSRPR
jgi:hypothetical protein